MNAWSPTTTGRFHACRGGRPEHSILTRYGALADLNVRSFRIQHCAVHDPGPRADRDLPDQDSRRGHERGGLHDGLGSAVPDQHLLASLSRNTARCVLSLEEFPPSVRCPCELTYLRSSKSARREASELSSRHCLRLGEGGVKSVGGWVRLLPVDLVHHPSKYKKLRTDLPCPPERRRDPRCALRAGERKLAAGRA